MASIGTLILTQETPPAVVNNNNTANAFMIGTADWGPGSASGLNTAVVAPASSLATIAGMIGPPNGGLLQNSRTTNNQVIYDSADAFFREGGANLYFSRVLGPAPTKGTLTIADGAAATCATLTAQYFGAGSSGINVAISNAASVYTVTVTDSAGTVLTTSPALTSTAAKTELINWAATTNLFTAASGASSNAPRTASVSAFSTGSDGTPGASVTYWSNALTSGFGTGLGPGQVMAPAQTNTAMPGIWSALASHAQTNNRIALLDGTDGNSAAAAVTELTTAALSSSLKGFCGIWAGNLKIPGTVAGTTRLVAPSPVVAALCARVDNLGNPNIAAAGTDFPLQYVSGVNTAYSGPINGDISTLNDAGINVFSNQLGVFQNFGFVSLYGTPTGDAIYWQLSHSRLRMSIVTDAQIVAQPFQFGQVDGQGQTLSSFSGALQGMLIGYYQTGALFGATPTQAFTVNAGPTVNTPATLQSGNLVAFLAVRMSPFAQVTTITINAVPITTQLISTAALGI